MIQDLNDLTSFKWATVTAVNPVLIQLDGDTAPLAMLPDSLIDPASLVVGDRVRVELSLRKVVIHGRSQGTLGKWLSWTPALTGTSVNIGTDATCSGRYVRIGKTIIFQAFIHWGTTGVASGSGAYTLSLPVPAAAAEATQFIGQGTIAPNGGTVMGSGLTAPLRGDGHIVSTYTGTFYGSTSPINGSQGNSYVSYFGMYEAAN